MVSSSLASIYYWIVGLHNVILYTVCYYRTVRYRENRWGSGIGKWRPIKVFAVFKWPARRLFQNALDERISDRNFSADFDGVRGEDLRDWKASVEFENLCRRFVIAAVVLLYAFSKYYFISAALNQVDTRPEGFNNQLYQSFAFKESDDFDSSQAVPTWMSNNWGFDSSFVFRIAA